MTNIRLLYVTSIILTVLNLFIVYTTFFTNLFNNSTFSFWYWPGASLIFMTLIILLALLSKCKHKLTVIVLGVLNIILLILFSTPLLLS
ncbi:MULTISPECIES: hypothetical protein [Staphylococcus]|uniref:hypothetical protein n=1 Tax=Staphylococcus TaxID=1279 RepID=UPI000951D9B9|nr:MULTISPECIES: hypothetical protein [Staphylococcus]AXV41159.1 hypothetical protein Ssp1_00530 [Staphylococcus sp. M0911]MBE9429359.1 hypothetical protein [Staphylococcus epidermidis]MBO0376652.1 hypothetical protein [Staphylococcus warneri]MDU9351993.1 hypothetical protein [Staphylococcus warneri]